MKHDTNRKIMCLGSLFDHFFAFLQFHIFFHKLAHPERSESCTEKNKKDVRRVETSSQPNIFRQPYPFPFHYHRIVLFLDQSVR